MFGGVLPMRAVPTSCPAAASDGDEGIRDRRRGPALQSRLLPRDRARIRRSAVVGVPRRDAFGAAEWIGEDDAHALVATVEARHFDATYVVGGDLVGMRATLYRRARAEALARWNRGLHVAAALVVEPRDTQP
ncbi:hypothetical protein JL721_11888 [Aureococcus anophagefferens]|nr:hypothetical protein JL721_11888 [Aureococcus anophagefferens]